MYAFWKRLLGGKFRKEPEEEYLTEINADYVIVKHPKKRYEQIAWAEIERITLVNTDEGPFLPDIWLVLSGGGKQCAIPHGSNGYNEVFKVVSDYEGFHFERVIESMGCTDNATFVLWERGEQH